MISNKVRETRRVRALKMPKNIERLYKEGKCRECSVAVTRMDFARILGKFTKVKIQYESSSSPKSQKDPEKSSPNTNARLKSNENGMVLIHRNAYNQHPAKALNSKKSKAIETPRQNNKTNANNTRQINKTNDTISSNVLKENNRLKNSLVKDKNSNYDKVQTSGPRKQYGIIFVDPSIKSNNDHKNKITLADLIPLIDRNILPSEEWCIDYLPKVEESKEDKVYDRIAAELEDLMYNEKPILKPTENMEITEDKAEDFPSIMDILNDNNTESSKTDQSCSVEVKSNLESSDVEAMLLGKPESSSTMDVDSTDVSSFIQDVAQLSSVPEVPSEEKLIESKATDDVENPQSPSILDETLQKGIEEQLICEPKEALYNANNDICKNSGEVLTNGIASIVAENKEANLKDNGELIIKTGGSNWCLPSNIDITHLIFRKTKEGNCLKSVTCPKNLLYTVQLEGKSVEFLGAPRFISSLEDLQVLLQIVNETELKSLYVLS